MRRRLGVFEVFPNHPAHVGAFAV